MTARSPTRTPPNRLAPAPQNMGAPSEAVEARLAQLQSQLERLKTQVRQAQQLSSLGTAAAMIAHEVNNLLTPMLGYAGTALETGDIELQKKALEVCVRNVKILVAMSDRVLKLSAAAPARREIVAVSAVLEGAVESLCRNLAKDGIRLTTQIDDSHAVWGDPLQIQQVLFNLLLNAREALLKSGGGRLDVSADTRDEHLLIEVSNGGEPIPPDLLSHVFEPFQSSKQGIHNGRERCRGLGLALCRDLVEENRGTINVTSSYETGTTFTVLLPVAQPPDAAPA